MACPCCGPKWACYQCCCPDGTPARNTVTIQVTPNSSYRVPYEVFEGTYTLALSPVVGIADQRISADPRARGATCLRYSFASAADNTGCRDVAGEPSKRIAFRQQPDGLVLTYWEFSGRDDQGRCVYVSSVVYSSILSYLCGGFSGLALQTVFSVDLKASGQRVGLAGFDVYIQ